ncbi:hypothetical protein CHARACLAT_007853 [Characodon lateralis]|uniref:Uncharacterized protein n=1 Tax=Characodon lateralis TaxID=208331 RepID=A0ABU7CQE6_9TELE|nr:hypothetical protein [Characodon lateralis]
MLFFTCPYLVIYLQAPEREGGQPLSSSLLMLDVSPGVLQAQRQSADASCQRQGKKKYTKLITTVVATN